MRLIREGCSNKEYLNKYKNKVDKNRGKKKVVVKNGFVVCFTAKHEIRKPTVWQLNFDFKPDTT